MIDSVVLLLRPGQFKIKDSSHFTGKETKQIHGKYSSGSKFSNRSALAKKEGLYFPRIVLPERVEKKADGTKWKVKTLEIQVSLPKLIYKTNIFEVDYTDYNSINTKLVKCLEEIGVVAKPEELRKAVVKRVDFSKVIRLPPYFGTARQVIKLLSNFNYKPNSEFTLKEYNDASEGIALKFWNYTQGYVIYDKFSEVIGNGYTLFELELVRAIQEGRLKKNVIKFELSLQRKQSLEAVIRRHIPNKKKDFTLFDILVNKDIAKEVLLEVFDKVFNPTNTSILTLAEMQENRVEQYLADRNLGVKQHALLFYLVNKATKIGELGLWEELRAKVRGGSFDRYKKEVASILADLGQIDGNTPNLINYLRKQHQKFEILRPK